MAWVGHTVIDSQANLLNESEQNLRQFLQACQTNGSRYFLRWPDRVSGFVSGHYVAKVPEGGLSHKGQLFDGDRELRWQRQGHQYSLLLLSNIDASNAGQSLEIHGQSFQAIGTHWLTETWNAQVYTETETRLPAVIAANGVNIHQRHFIDQTTATVHFTALVVAPPVNTQEDL